MVRMLGFPPAREVLSESGVFTSRIDRRHRGVTGADAGARARLEAAFAREERRELMVASATRTAAVAVILGWLALSTPERGLAFAWVLGTASIFLVTGLVQLWVYQRAWAPSVMPYVFMLVDSLALAAALLLPNPFQTPGLPRALPLRYASFLYFFVLLMQAAFSFRPRLLVWTGLCGAAAWTLGFLWIATRPESIVDLTGGGDRLAMLTAYFNPNFVSVLKYENEILAFLLVSAGLALLVRRSRALVIERAEAERARGNLARHFSRGGDGVAPRSPRPHGGGSLSLSRLPGEVHRRRAAGDVRSPRRGNARRDRRARLRARDARGAGGVEPRARGGGPASAPHGRRPALRSSRAGGHRQRSKHGVCHRRRHHERRQPVAGPDARSRDEPRGQPRAR